MKVILKLNVRIDAHLGVCIEEKTLLKLEFRHFCTVSSKLKGWKFEASMVFKMMDFQGISQVDA
jgi:hypothetical protein